MPVDYYVVFKELENQLGESLREAKRRDGTYIAAVIHLR